MRFLLTSLAFIFIFGASAQKSIQTQTIRGTVTEAFTGSPLAGALVTVIYGGLSKTEMSGEDGNFSLTNIKLGRCTLRISLMGYNNSEIPNILLNSGKETVIDIKLEEKVTQLNEVVVKNSDRKDSELKDLGIISGRSFSIEQTERFAGSLGDPAKMVANYAGVMTGNDSRNDIVIRGNSPLGVLWRLEGVEIPNPNHFGAQGSTGGAVSMLNSNLLTNSNFLMGAFPAEFGNATSGVFDINMRSGNNQKYEFTGQVGLNGFEAAAEGPFRLGKKGPKGSFIVDYRYSTLSLMSKLGFRFGTGTAVPRFQDFTFLVDLPTKTAGRFKLITLMGNNKISLGRDLKASTNLTQIAQGTATDFGSSVAFFALTHTYFFSENTKLKTSLSYNSNATTTVFDTINYADNSFFNFYHGKLRDEKQTLTTQLKHRISNRDNLTIGVIYDLYKTSFVDSAWVKKYNRRISIRNIEGKNSGLLKTYASFQHKFSDRFLLNTGLYGQYYDLSKEFSLEPRLSASWQLNDDQTLSFGYGLHSQIQSRIIYYTQKYDSLNNSYAENNRNLKSTKAHHFILGFEQKLGNNFRFKTETYYQSLFHVPVSKVAQQYSMLNMGAEYYLESHDSLVNTGKGYNYGVEFTFEKMLNRGYYFLLTASLFESKYQGYDKVWRNTLFNNNFVLNLLGGYELKLGKNNFLTFDLKSTWSGGRRRSPIDLQASIAKGEAEYDHTHDYETRFKDYFRTDLRIGYKLNSKNMTQEWAFDFENISNTDNIYSETYNSRTQSIENSFQQGFMPMLLYRINF